MLRAGHYHTLKVARTVNFGLYLTDGEEDVLLPVRYVPEGIQEGDMVEVFIYHDSENRLIATTQKPYGTAGEIVLLRAAGVSEQGAFLDWGLMKDLFVAKSQQLARMREGQSYLVQIYVDERTGRVAATEKFAAALSNDDLTVNEMDPVQLTIWQKTDIGYKVIINHRHTGVLHFNESFSDYGYGDRLPGFIKQIKDGRIDVVAGQPGYERVKDSRGKILDLLRSHSGFLPFTDKSSPELIYEFFGMSKKTFKMTLGTLYKEKLIDLTKSGIRLL